jgi:hypothetical protein
MMMALMRMRRLRPMSVLLTRGRLDRCDDDGADAHAATMFDVSAADAGVARPMR